MFLTWETLGEAAGGVFSLPKYQINWQLEWMKSGDRWEPHLSQPYCGDAQGELAYSKNSSSHTNTDAATPTTAIFHLHTDILAPENPKSLTSELTTN